MSETRFAFGENWASFLNHLDEDRIDQACRSLTGLLCLDDATGRPLERSATPSTVGGAPATFGKGLTKTSSSPRMASTTTAVVEPAMMVSTMTARSELSSPKIEARKTAFLPCPM